MLIKKRACQNALFCFSDTPSLALSKNIITMHQPASAAAFSASTL